MSSQQPPPHHTVIVRLPFPRGDFEDPPQTEWDSNKDKALWRLISESSNSKDLNWASMTQRFDVPLPFLLQQAAYLYRRHFEGMQAQMKRLGGEIPVAIPKPTTKTSQESATSDISGNTFAMRSTLRPRASASDATKGQTADDLGSIRRLRPDIQRHPSTGTITQSKVVSSQTQLGQRSTVREPYGSTRVQHHEERGSPAVQTQKSEDFSASQSSEDSASSRRPVQRRPQISRKAPPHRQESGPNAHEDGGDYDNDDDGGYLPFAATSRPSFGESSAKHEHQGKQKVEPESLVSSGSSAAPLPTHTGDATMSRQASGKPKSAWSPRQRAELEKLGVRSRKSGSEGSPSMGSSFSDLDAESVSQSALEEALLSNMRNNAGGSLGMGFSRMSSLREVLGRRASKDG